MEQLQHFFFQQDGQINKAYDLRWYNDSRTYIRICAAVAAASCLGFIPFDFAMLDRNAALFLFWLRVLILFPIAVMIFLMTYRDHLSYRIFSLIAVGFTVAGVGFSIAGAMTDGSKANYILNAELQIGALILVLVRLPWRLALTSAAIISLSFIFVLVVMWDLPSPQLVTILIGYITVMAILALGAVLRDRQALALFKAEQALHIAQEEKNNWSKTFTRFLKHELSNQIAGISLSLQMLERTAKLEGNTYIQRGQQSVVELQELLNRAVEAVTIDDIVADATREELSLDSLIDDLLFEYNLKVGDTRVVAQAASSERAAMSAVLGNALQLKQLLRNLIDNGIRHASNGSVVEVATPEPGVITVKNRGEPLPENPEKLFELWHSGSGNAGLFGMGLYLARKIALAHGGELTASRPEDGQGAVFRLQLPRGALIDS